MSIYLVMSIFLVTKKILNPNRDFSGYDDVNDYEMEWVFFWSSLNEYFSGHGKQPVFFWLPKISMTKKIITAKVEPAFLTGLLTNHHHHFVV